jgi:prevent-host-death family protein
LNRVERGEEIVITRRGKPVAHLVASKGHMDRAKAKEAAQFIRARAQRLPSGVFDWETLKADGDEGRL